VSRQQLEKKVTNEAKLLEEVNYLHGHLTVERLIKRDTPEMKAPP
jgi:hypothetical protein